MDERKYYVKQQTAEIAAAGMQQRERLRAYLMPFRFDEAETEALVSEALQRARVMEADRPDAAFEQLEMLLDEMTAVSLSTPSTQRSSMQPEAVSRRPVGFFIRRVLQPVVGSIRPPQTQR